MYISQFIEYFLGDIISAAYSVPPKVYDEDEETDDEFYRDDPDYVSGGVTPSAIQTAVSKHFSNTCQSGVNAVTQGTSGEELARKKYKIQPEQLFPYFKERRPQTIATAWYLVGVLEQIITEFV